MFQFSSMKFEALDLRFIAFRVINSRCIATMMLSHVTFTRVAIPRSKILCKMTFFNKKLEELNKLNVHFYTIANKSFEHFDVNTYIV